MKPEKKTAKKAKHRAARVSRSSADARREPPSRRAIGASVPSTANPEGEHAGVRAALEARPAGPQPRFPGKADGVSIPPILLETETPAAPGLTGPGERYVLGPVARAEARERTGGQKELPESYGTGRLFLTACDPHRLHVSWDLSLHQQKEYNSLSADGHLVMRIYIDSFEERPFSEVHFLPEARSSFVPVARGGTTYLAELGYRDRASDWKRISTSGPVRTPQDDLSEDTSLVFATIPPEASVEEALEVISAAVGEDVPLEEAIPQLRAEGHKALPPASPRIVPRSWAPAQEQALAALVSMETVRQAWMGSLEVPELIQGHQQRDLPAVGAAGISSIGLGQPPPQPGGVVSSVSVPFRETEEKKAFWFSVNAELVIYGATEPDAQVALGGRLIKLRPDGTFSFRFALPDGEYQLPALAISADGEDARLAVLHFKRKTEYTGEVGVQAGDPKLPTPAAASFG